MAIKKGFARSITNIDVTRRILDKLTPSSQSYNPVTDEFFRLDDSGLWNATPESEIVDVIRITFSEIQTEAFNLNSKLSVMFEHQNEYKLNMTTIKRSLAREHINTNLIAFSDGVLNLENGEVEPHKADYHITRTLPFPYSVSNTELNPDYAADYRMLYELFSYQSGVVVLNASRDYSRQIIKLSGDFYHRYEKSADRSNKGINPALYGKQVCEIVATYEKIPYDVLSKFSDGQKLSYKRPYKEQQAWDNTCTFLISFDEITAKREHESVAQDITKLPFMREWKPRIPLEQITPELVSAILAKYGSSPEFESNELTDSDKPSILDYLQENFTQDSKGFISRTEITEGINEYCEQHKIKRSRGDRKKALDRFCDFKLTSKTLDGEAVMGYRGLNRQQSIPSGVATVNLPSEASDNGTLNLEILKGAYEIAEPSKTIQEIFGLYQHSTDHPIADKREFERLINESGLYTVEDDIIIPKTG